MLHGRGTIKDTGVNYAIAATDMRFLCVFTKE